MNDPTAPFGAARLHPRTAPCRSCGEFVVVGDRFCNACGLDLRLLLPPTRARDRAELDTGVAAGATDRGGHRDANEDAIAVARARTPEGATVAVGVVCDGVSSSAGAGGAARAAASAAVRALVELTESGIDPSTATRAAVSLASRAVAELDGSGGAPPRGGPSGRGRVAPACTYVSAVATATTVTVGWVGDSRAYWLAPAGGAKPLAGGTPPGESSALLTADDSWAAHMIRRGLLDEAAAYADPRAHAIVRWIGGGMDEVAPRIVSLRPREPGVVLVCSDGLWNYLSRAEDMARAAAPHLAGSALDIARALVRLALRRGGHDNVSAVAVPFPPAADTPEAGGAGERHGDSEEDLLTTESRG